MQLDHKTLALALKRASYVVEKKNYIPILSHVKFEAGAMTATDLDLCLIQSLPFNGPGDPVFTADLASLAAALGVTEPGDMIDLAPVGGFAKNDGKPQCRLPPGDFPVFNTLPDDLAGVSVTQGDLRAWLQACRRSISDDATRYYLNGIYLHAPNTTAGPDSLTMVSTDGYRLGKVATATPWPFPGVILPRKAVDVLLRLLDAPGVPVSIAATARGIRFVAPGWVLQSKALDGTFPDYARVIPSVAHQGATLDPALLLRPVGKLLTLAKGNGRSAACKLDTGAQTFSIAGEIDASLDVRMPRLGNSVTFGVNLPYLRDLLTTLSEAGAVGHMTQGNSGDPIRIEAQSKTFNGTLTLIQMPLRT